MAAVGGSIESISIDGRLFPVAADSDASIDTGGFSVEHQANGDGSARDVMTRKIWMVDGLNVEIDHYRGDLQFLQEKSDTPGGRFPITVTLVNGVTYQGSGKPTGDIKASSQNATAAITLSGPGKLEQQ